MGELAEAVKTGKPAFDLVYGIPFFTFLSEHPEHAAVFQGGASSFARNNIPRILEAYDFSRFKTIVDVGGGHGTLLRGILERHESLRGVLCDLPGTIAAARDLRESSVGARCEFVASDMFASVWAGGDAYTIKQVLHDFNDDEVVRILKNVRRAMADDGRLVVIECLNDTTGQACWPDLYMMVLLTGRERTTDEFGELYRQAGFRLERAIKTTGPLWILEGVPV